jgi:hypothetical protein
MLGRFRSVAPLLSLTALLALSLHCQACASSSDGDGGQSADEELRRKAKLQLVVTVDWEGRDLREENLRAMEALRARFPQIKIVHFLNANYYEKPLANAADVTARINRVLRPGDEKGLHIHGWKRLFEASDVTFRGSPTFWGTTIDPRSRECLDDCGHEVPISLYSSEELRHVVKFSLDTLEANGFGRAKSFRCGGWMARQSVRDAIAAEGLKYEHSEVPVTFLQPKLGKLPLFTWLSEVWPDATPLSQPHVLPTATASLTEIPDNGALSDYVVAQQMVDVFEQNKAEFLKTRTRSQVVSIGFHQETAATFLPQLTQALDKILAEVAAESLPFESATSASLSAAPVK